MMADISYSFDPDYIKQALHGISDVVLIAGPAGAGKTTISMRIIEGIIEKPTGLQNCEHISRTDCKSLPQKQFPTGGLIIEFAINRMLDTDYENYVAKLVEQIGLHTRVHSACLIEIPRLELIRRYLTRMTPVQFLHLGKLKSLVTYSCMIGFFEHAKKWDDIMQERAIVSRRLKA